MEIQLTGSLIFNLVIGVAGTFISFWIHGLDKKFDELKAQINDIKHEYQSKEIAQEQAKHLDDVLTEIRNELKRINEKLDKKADK